MRLPKKKLIWISAAVLILIVVSGLFFFGQRKGVEFVTETAKRERLLQTVDANGEVVSVDEVDLSFDLSGTIGSVAVKIGDSVAPGDLLATLDTDELAADVQAAYQAMLAAQGTLNKQRAGSSDEEIAVQEAAVLIASANLEAARIESQNAQMLYEAAEKRYGADVEASEKSVVSAQDNFNQTKIETAADAADAYDDEFSAAWACVIEVRNGVAKADEILGLRNGSFNDEYETSLAARDSSAKESATAAFYIAETSRDKAERAVLAADYGLSEKIDAAALLTQEAAADTADLLLFVRRAVEATPIGGDYSVSDSSSLIASVDAIRVSLQTDQSALQNAIQSVNESLRTSSQSIEDAQNELDKARKSLESTRELANYQILSAKNSLDTALVMVNVREAEHTKTIASREQVAAAPRSVDLASYESEVERARAAYEAARARLAKAEIRSPISGSVTEVSFEIGEQVTATTPVVTVQTTQEQFKIVADVAESDISKVSIGDQVELSFDAFGSDVVAFGTVGKIDPAEKTVESVVYYEVTIYLNEGQSSFVLRPGLSVDLVITTEVREGALTVSQRAVTSEEDKKYVRVLKEGKQEKLEVAVGLRGDMGRVEILSGIREGDQIIIRENE
jgi:multidrug efflux pump subunit AcrA (membrane-fusion protein)